MKSPIPNLQSAIDEALPDQSLAPRVLSSDLGSAPGDDGDIITDAARAKAYSAVYEWQGNELHPYTITREAIFNAARIFTILGSGDLPKTYDPVYLQSAILLLYIVAADDAELRKQRHNAALIIDAAESWALDHVPRHLADEAGRLAFQILHEATITTAIPRPEGSAPKSSGN